MFESAAPWIIYLAAALIGYGLGSIPFGLLLTRAAGLGDVRSIGSGNIGATNVLRTGNKKLAAATLLLDLLKGTAAVLILRLLIPTQPDAATLSGVAAFLGHLFPIWLGFKGGKGVATYIGVLLGLFWPAVLIFAGVWIAVAYFSRYSSLGALVATLVVPLSLWGLDETTLAAVFALLTAIVWAKHHANIRRLLSGTEGKIGHKG
ncbi:glycerol-3-phosphate acyltransferase [Pleomorphomonas diazotrophica]|uniref:Glycerol-3-phosphate acyltransferase n=1 Tax=Pleomorphomonas diazotrophica TaxID=1166257 RepID=A0A1I4QX04_9HYPH|nr:glycerol-3-phosphate 1-O-acyltransferase PlsY [Pleomorphomonas diazotrophica]PKR90363.1 glycerol-3-phosphate acyltransferase [Pleomorphomonas diazotrophica]SFM44579.1 acyl-phosphate glycerol-3-phosphate acyltransferase [Pleomorphomonas diazotrophica]